jgi:putative colanic acid biosynthesis UDP-glucose lipid carrier transferase
MIASRTKGIAKAGIACQCLIVAGVFWVWLLLAHAHAGFWNLDVSRYAVYNAVLLIGIVLAYATASSNTWFTQFSFFVCHRHAFRQTAFSAGLLLLLLVGESDHTISRVFLFTLVPILYGILIATQRLLPPVLQRLSLGGLRMQRVLLAGSCQNVSTLEGWLASKQHLGYTITGLVCHDRSIGIFGGFKILGTLEDLERIIVEQDITHVILVEFPAYRHFLTHYTQVCERHGVRLLVICDFERTLRHPVTMFEDEGLRFIGLRDEPLEDPIGRFAKRCLDIAVALPMVLFILPFTTLFVACLQMRYAPGPIFYRQLRSGLQNIPFAIYKYRTMYVANPDPSRQVTQGDTRVYPAGRWLRKFSIDELPQFLNVLRGEMSVVGPRPHLLEHDEQFAQALANYPVRGNVKPGITGLAQVRGFRGETKTTTDVIKRVESDIQYLENWSFLMDCWIILRTAAQMVFPPRTAL